MSPNKCPVKPGFYKIVSASDGSALTVTDEGRPSRAVVTSTRADKEEQQWKVKYRPQENIVIIRSEVFHENDVSKKLVDSHWVAADWSFTAVPNGKENTFVLENGVGALTNNGEGQRVSFETVDASAPNQHWEFEFLFEISKPNV